MEYPHLALPASSPYSDVHDRAHGRLRTARKRVRSFIRSSIRSFIRIERILRAVYRGTHARVCGEIVEPVRARVLRWLPVRQRYIRVHNGHISMEEKAPHIGTNELNSCADRMRRYDGARISTSNGRPSKLHHENRGQLALETRHALSIVRRRDKLHPCDVKPIYVYTYTYISFFINRVHQPTLLLNLYFIASRGRDCTVCTFET